MKYMLMMHAPRAGWKDAGIGTWPMDDIKAHIEFMKRFNKELTEAGELVGAQGLSGPEEARIVRADKAGAPEVTDGPYPEAKEFLAGYWIVDCESTERAYEIRGARVGGAGQGRRTDEHAHRGARGDERAARRNVTELDAEWRGRAPAARACAAGARRGRPPLRRFRRRRGRRAGGAARGRPAVAAGGRARQPARLADPGRRAAHDRPVSRRDGAPSPRSRRHHAGAGGRARRAAARRRDRRLQSRTTRSSCCSCAVTRR